METRRLTCLAEYGHGDRLGGTVCGVQDFPAFAKPHAPSLFCSLWSDQDELSSTGPSRHSFDGCAMRIRPSAGWTGSTNPGTGRGRFSVRSNCRQLPEMPASCGLAWLVQLRSDEQIVYFVGFTGGPVTTVGREC